MTLYGLVNNAGIGLSTGNDTAAIMNTNYNGVKRVTDAFVDLIDKTNGRIVNTSSGVAPMWIRDQVMFDEISHKCMYTYVLNLLSYDFSRMKQQRKNTPIQIILLKNWMQS